MQHGPLNYLVHYLCLSIGQLSPLQLLQCRMIFSFIQAVLLMLEILHNQKPLHYITLQHEREVALQVP